MTLTDPSTATLREPDYVSGASLAIGRDFFEQLGGFDLRCYPACYEDTDLAFRVRARPWRVYCKPGSRGAGLRGGERWTGRGWG